MQQPNRTDSPRDAERIKNGYSGVPGRVAAGGGGGDAGLKSEVADLKAQKEHMATEIKQLKADVKRLKIEKRMLIMGSAAATKNILAAGGAPTDSAACAVM
eukprot:SAG22_NODE_232_length_14402_cov_58.042159_6_plen_101_part_00